MSDRPRERVLEELRAEARFADERVTLYRRRMYMGKGEQRRLEELIRVAEGARGRLQRAEQDA